MPNIKSAKKRARQNVKLRLANRDKKSAIRSQEKKLRQEVKENKLDEASKTLSFFSKLIDKAAKRNIFHSNAASRKKSRLANLLNKAQKAS